MSSLKVLVLVLVALAYVVVVLTRVRLSKEGRVAGRAEISRRVLGLHTVSGLLGATLFLAYLVAGDVLGGLHDLVGILGLAGLWVTAVCGLAILARWLPSRGRHAQEAHDDDWAEGPGLSLVAHLGMLVGVVVMTVGYMLQEV